MNDLPLFLKRYVQSLAGCAYFFAGGALLKKHRPLLYALSRHFGFEAEVLAEGVEQASVFPEQDAAGEEIGAAGQALEIAPQE